MNLRKEKICKLCQKPVVRFKDDYEIFEKMHWLCFHIIFEHEGDPDESCGDPSCPWLHIQLLKKEIVSLGGNPDLAIEKAITNKFE